MAKLRPEEPTTHTEPDSSESIEETLSKVKAMVRNLIAERERLLKRVAELEGRQ